MGALRIWRNDKKIQSVKFVDATVTKVYDNDDAVCANNLLSKTDYTNINDFELLKNKVLNGEAPCYDVAYHASEPEKINQAKIIITNLFLNNLPNIVQGRVTRED